MKPVVGVLALQGDVPEHLRALEAAGARPAAVRRPEELDLLDGLVIPGGESTTLWRLSVAFDVLEPLREFRRRRSLAPRSGEKVREARMRGLASERL